MKFRFLLRSVIFLGWTGLLGTAALYPRGIQQLSEQAIPLKKSLHSFANEKSIEFDGDFSGAEAAVQRLPMDENILYWQLNLDEIGRSLEKNPSVLQAQVTRCEAYSIRCFRIAVTPRVPRGLVADQQGSLWAVGVDGGFARRITGVTDDFPRGLPLFDGVFSDNPSPELAKKRLQHLVFAVDEIESVRGRKVRSLTMSRGGELSLQFQGFTPRILLSGLSASWPQIRKEVSRADTLIRLYKGREEAIESIDVSLKQMAVVKERLLTISSTPMKENKKGLKS